MAGARTTTACAGRRRHGDKEPGKTGSQWRVHFSLRLPELLCDFFQITASEGNRPVSTCGGFPLLRGISS